MQIKNAEPKITRLLVNRRTILAVLAIFLIGLDRYAKVWAWQVGQNQSQSLMPWLRLSYWQNSGLALSLPLGGLWPIILSAVGLVILIIILINRVRQKSFNQAVNLGQVILGAFSNL